MRWEVRPNAYHDSVKLMRVSEALTKLPGVHRAAAVMATPLNVDLLTDDGMRPDVPAGPHDLLIVVDGEDEAAERALAEIDALLAPRASAAPVEAAPARLVEQTGGTLAVVAVPGQYAATEAYAALRAGMHVFLFSDNVSVEDEARLKRMAAERDLLMMGPDCGTAILDGVGLGFANRVERGPVGIAGASGTGIQQVCCLLDAARIGVAQAIGTGGRDLSAAVGGSMTRRALRLLEEDAAVEVVCLISKPADPDVAAAMHGEMARLAKPVIACLLGERKRDEGSVRYADNLTDTADLIAETIGRPHLREGWLSYAHLGEDPLVAGFFAGGTLCSEAGRVLDGLGVAHQLLDLGVDEYTRGRAHPIIDPRLRVVMLERLAAGEERPVVLLDVILGDLADPDPAGSLRPALERLRERAIPVHAVLVGARSDPQGLTRQQATLKDAGCRVFTSNAEAARAAGLAVRG